MSIRFSRVSAVTENKAVIFLVGGVPTNQGDLDHWTAFRDFARELPANESIFVAVETFEYGGEEPFDATPEEIAYIYKREESRPYFIETRSKKMGDSDFQISLTPSPLEQAKNPPS